MLFRSLFFFGTGYAAGLSPKQKCVDWRSVLKKVGWLILADQTLLWSGGIRLGMDFFGFIAVSVLVMAFLQGLRHSQIICIGAILFLLSVRYAARDLVESVINQEGVLVWATGVRGQDGWSYPLSPWLVAPLAGFLCARRSSEPKLKHRILITPIALMVGIALTTILHYRGFIFFRWGSVSVAYFVLATPIILVTFLFAEWITGRYSRIAARLSLRGASAFLVVPVHYGALALLKDTGMTVWTSSNWLLGLASMLLLSGVAVLSSQQLATKLSLYQLHLRSGAATLLMGVLLFTAWTSTAHTLIGGLSCAAVQCIIAVRLTR